MDVICLGILVADIFSSPMDSLPKAGELKITEQFLLSAGGCAANTAACLRRLDRTVTVLGKVGRDAFGDFVLSDLERLGIETSSIQRSPTRHTSETFILNVRGEDRRYLHHIGANADFSLADVDFSVLQDARILYVGGYCAMPSFSPAELAELFREAKVKSLTTVLDVVVPAGAKASLNDVAAALPYTDYFLPNEDESQALTGLAAPREQAEAFSRLNPHCTIVITQGPRGSMAKQGKRFVETKGFAMDSIDGSGAGDAFAAGLITGLLEGWPLERTLRFASAVGASCTTAVGCTAGVFHFDEAVKFVEQHSAAPGKT